MAGRVPPSIALIQGCIDSIEARLRQPIALEALAAEAGMSFWHFLRVFRATVGETLKDYIRRRRLTLAAYALLETGHSVLEIALDSGFESHEAFSRAFRAQFGCTPRDFRHNGRAPSLPRAQPQISADYLRHLQQGVSREPVVTEHPHLRLVGLKTELSVAPDAFDLLQLGRPLWDAFRPRLSQIRQRLDDRVLLLCDILASDDEHVRCQLLLGVAVGDFVDVPDDCVAQTRPRSRDAVFRHRGGGRSWEYTLQYLFGMWLPNAGAVLSDLPLVYRFDVERSPFSAEPELDIWLALAASPSAASGARENAVAAG